MQRSYSIKRAIFMIGSLAFLCILCSTSGPFRSVEGQGVTAREANSQLWHCHVPIDATDVWFDSSYSSTLVECSIEEQSFRRWCELNGWGLQPIVEGNPVNIYAVRDRHMPPIESGLWFDHRKKERPDLGTYGVYDARSKRAYLFYSSR